MQQWRHRCWRMQQWMLYCSLQAVWNPCGAPKQADLHGLLLGSAWQRHIVLVFPGLRSPGGCMLSSLSPISIPFISHLSHGLECLGPHAVLFVSPLFTMSPLISKLCPTGLLFVLQLSSRSWVPSAACFAHCLPLDTDLSPAWHSFDFNLFATFLLGDGYLEPYLGRLALVSHLFTICFQIFSGLSPDFQLTCLPLGSHFLQFVSILRIF